jgi:hypothetical protein
MYKFQQLLDTWKDTLGTMLLGKVVGFLATAARIIRARKVRTLVLVGCCGWLRGFLAGA